MPKENEILSYFKLHTVNHWLHNNFVCSKIRSWLITGLCFHNEHFCEEFYSRMAVHRKKADCLRLLPLFSDLGFIRQLIWLPKRGLLTFLLRSDPKTAQICQCVAFSLFAHDRTLQCIKLDGANRHILDMVVIQSKQVDGVMTLSLPISMLFF